MPVFPEWWNLHLSHQTGEKSAKAVASQDGLLVVDYGGHGTGRRYGDTAPEAVPLERLNLLLAEFGELPLAEHEHKPVQAA